MHSGKKVNTASPSVLQHKDYGSILDNGSYRISCDQLPKNLSHILSSNDDAVIEEDELPSIAYDIDDSNDEEDEHY